MVQTGGGMPLYKDPKAVTGGGMPRPTKPIMGKPARPGMTKPIGPGGKKPQVPGMVQAMREKMNKSKGY
jgi:hypothetical protein